MHELFPVAGAMGGTLSLYVARLVWLRHRRKATFRVGDRAPPIGELPAATPTAPFPAIARAAPVVVLFMSNSCPGVKAYDVRLRALHEAYGARGVSVIGVNSIDEDLYPAEDLASMTKAVKQRRLPFAYVKDADQQLARAFGALCTPHVFLLDADRRLRYRGRIDDAMLERKVTKHFLRDAIEAVLQGRPAPVPETAPLGCAIELSRQKKLSPNRPANAVASR